MSKHDIEPKEWVNILKVRTSIVNIIKYFWSDYCGISISLDIKIQKIYIFLNDGHVLLVIAMLPCKYRLAHIITSGVCIRLYALYSSSLWENAVMNSVWIQKWLCF
jgi:hypothetical protein